LGPLGTAATIRPIVPDPGDYNDGEIGGMIGRGNRMYQEKTCPSAALSTKCCPDANPVRRGWKPATNRLSYGTASTKFPTIAKKNCGYTKRTFERRKISFTLSVSVIMPRKAATQNVCVVSDE
jgi:hypothetical protein